MLTSRKAPTVLVGRSRRPLASAHPWSYVRATKGQVGSREVGEPVPRSGRRAGPRSAQHPLRPAARAQPACHGRRRRRHRPARSRASIAELAASVQASQVIVARTRGKKRVPLPDTGEDEVARPSENAGSCSLEQATALTDQGEYGSAWGDGRLRRRSVLRVICRPGWLGVDRTLGAGRGSWLRERNNEQLVAVMPSTKR